MGPERRRSHAFIFILSLTGSAIPTLLSGSTTLGWNRLPSVHYSFCCLPRHFGSPGHSRRLQSALLSSVYLSACLGVPAVFLRTKRRIGKYCEMVW